MIVFQDVVVFDQFIPDTTAVYSGPELYGLLGSAEKLFVQLRSQQAAATSPTIAVDLQTTNDPTAGTWRTKAQLITSGNFVTTQYFYANDPGSEPGGGFSRLKITLGASSASAQIRVTVTGRVG